MGNFIFKLVLFFIPIALLFIIPLIVFYEAREFTDLDVVIEEQRVSPHTLFGLAYNNLDRPYKERMVVLRNPEVVALGTSRMTQVRSSFFNSPEAFVNAGAAVSELEDMVRFIEKLPPSTKLLILGVDQQLFRPERKPIVNKAPLDPLRAFFAGGWRSAYLDLFLGKFSLGELGKKHAHLPYVGLNALVSTNGFLGDGSYYYGTVTDDPERVHKNEALVQDVLAQIRNDRSDFYYGARISEEQLETLRDILALCKERGITALGIVPPYAPALYEEMVSEHDAYGKTAKDLPKTLGTVFSEYGFSVFDYSNARAVGITDTEFIDPGHASDKAYLRILIDIARRSPELREYVSIQTMQNILDNARGDFVY